MHHTIERIKRLPRGRPVTSFSVYATAPGQSHCTLPTSAAILCRKTAHRQAYRACHAVVTIVTYQYLPIICTLCMILSNGIISPHYAPAPSSLARTLCLLPSMYGTARYRSLSAFARRSSSRRAHQLCNRGSDCEHDCRKFEPSSSPRIPSA